MKKSPASAQILLVEDDFFLLDLYQHVLTKSGFTILVANDGESAIAIAAQQPDLILLDIMLPKKNGLEVLKILKSTPKTAHIPVILLTNLGQGDIIRQAFEEGAQGYLLKMRVDPYALVALIRPYLENPNYTMDIDRIIFDE